MKRFRFLDHGGDVGVEVLGASLSELFQNAAEAFFRIITDPKTVRRKQSRRLTLKGETPEQLLVAWLNELLYLFETERLLLSRFRIDRIDEGSLEAHAEGETYDERRHPIKTLVKAVTFHQLQLHEEEGLWKARIIFDL